MFEQLETTILNSLQTIFDQFGWLGVAALMAFENTTGITPSEIILGLAGWMLIEAHGLPLSFVFLGGLYAAIGSLIGSSITYWGVRLGGRPLVDRLARQFRFPAKYLDRAEELFQQRGTVAVFLGRMIPGVRILITIPAGLARMRYPIFAAATFSGAYLWCTLLLAVGFVFGYEWPLISEAIRGYLPYLIVAAGVAVVIAGGWFLWTRQKALPTASTTHLE